MISIEQAQLQQLLSAIGTAQAALSEASIPTHVDDRGFTVCDDEDLDEFLSEKEQTLTTLGAAVEAFKAQQAAATVSVSREPGHILQSNDPVKLRAAVSVYQSRCDSLSEELREYRKRMAIVEEREKRTSNWARELMNKENTQKIPADETKTTAGGGESSTLAMIKAMNNGAEYNPASNPAGAKCGQCGPQSNNSSCTHKEVLASHIIDRTFDEHKNLLREQLRAAKTELEKFTSGEMFTTQKQMIYNLERELKEQQLKYGEVATKVTTLTAENHQLKSELRSLKFEMGQRSSAPTALPSVGGSGGGGPLVLLQQQMHFARVMQQQHMQQCLIEDRYEALMAVVKEGVQLAVDHVPQYIPPPPAATGGGDEDHIEEAIVEEEPPAEVPPSKPDSRNSSPSFLTQRRATPTAPARAPPQEGLAYASGQSGISRAPLHTRQTTTSSRGGYGRGGAQIVHLQD